MPDEEIKKEEQKVDESVSDGIASSRDDSSSSSLRATTGSEAISEITSSSRQIGTPRNDEEEAPRNDIDELEKIKKERDEYLAGWQRAKADFLNYQKDERKRLEEFLKFCEAGLLADLLLALDSFDLALKEIASSSRQIGTPRNDKENTPRNDEEEAPRGDKLEKGFFLIKSQIDEILKKRGLEPIKSLGEKFNPELHEAMGTVEDSSKEPSSAKATEGESQTISEEIQKGYILNGKVLRVAKVKVVK